MTSAPSTTTTTKTVNNKTGVTVSKSVSTSGGSVTTTSTTTIGKATTTAPSSVSTPSSLPGTCLGSKWIAGPNDSGWTLCAPVAVANHLLGTLGVEAPNAAIERLYQAAGGTGKHAAPLASVLAAARCQSLAGCRLKAFRRAGLDDADILLLAFPGEEEVHSAAFAGMSLIMWGGEIPLEDVDANVKIIDAWSLTWHGQEEITRG